jgi:hypothetical protein
LLLWLIEADVFQIPQPHKHFNVRHNFMATRFELDEEIELYYGTGFKRTHLLWELFANADRVINSVYIFKHFDEYCRQLNSDKQEDKLEVYWNASYHEKLIDYIKIVVAFETMNKALLLKKGFLIHKIAHTYDEKLHKKQASGIPIDLQEFYNNNYTSLDWIRREARLNGLTPNLSTINFSHTLNDNYQEILPLDKNLLHHLKDINFKRNRLHLYSDFKGAFEVSRHIAKWKFIRESSLTKIRTEYSLIDEELKNCA